MADRQLYRVVRAASITVAFVEAETLQGESDSLAESLSAALAGAVARLCKPKRASRKAKRVGSKGSRHG